MPPTVGEVRLIAFPAAGCGARALVPCTGEISFATFVPDMQCMETPTV